MPHTTPIILALAGNPNSGKTTAFNFYTGSRQHVANYPGITVERKEGFLRAHDRDVRLIDLPGTYALTAYTEDELVARRGLTPGGPDAPDCVINVLNAGALERNLYLSVQILELGLPLVLALNMHDEAEKQGMIINCGRLAELLGIPVVPTVARSGIGLDKALAAAVQVSLDRRAAKSSGLGGAKPLDISYGPDLDPVIQEFTALIEGNEALCARYPARWIAIKYLENDSEIRDLVAAADSALDVRLAAGLEQVTRHLKSTTGSYPEAIIADYRYGFISSLLRQGVVTRQDELRNRVARSDQLDKVLTHRFFGPLILLGVLYSMYKITFGLGEIPMGWVEAFFGWLSESVSGLLAEGLLKSLLVSGMIDGVGSVMGFVPLILTMFLLISVLEDSGYMARVAYMMDRVLRAFGLHGYSVMPFIISGGIAGGCAVPGVLATRTLRSPREKLATLLTLPFMTCGAKLPVFLLLAAAFFPGNETSVMLIISLVAWGMALMIAKLLRSTIIRGESTPFVMELPPYRLPTLFGVLIHTWERTWQYIKKAGTVILAISIVIWASMTFPELPEEMAAKDDSSAARLEYSFAGRLGKSLELVTAPAGFDWRVNIALLGGIGAKEVIVSTLGTAYSLSEEDIAAVEDSDDTTSLQSRLRGDPNWNPVNAAALMAFVLLYAPCFVTLAVMRQETGSWKWSAFSLIFNTLLAFAVAVAVYQVGMLVI
ncbi:MAG: ferrous iron transport protein B [Deltaproteobacteria bacterium]|jgi:ferrous iron transport protein B|nr:ferrous iron transport protein B [Deltaproteobacteria bacterium]